MKKCFFIFIKSLALGAFILGLFLLNGCKKEDDVTLPTDSTETTPTDSIKDSIVVDGKTYIYVRTVAPTCQFEGYDLYECRTGYKPYPTIYRNQKEPLGHDLDYDNPRCSWDNENSANVSLRCTRCDSYYTLSGNSYYINCEEVTPATCTQTGLKVYTIYYYRAESEIVPLDNVYEVVTPMLDHTPVSNHDGVIASCTQTGFTDSISCSTCNTLLTERKIIPETHIPVENDDAVSATCTEVGYTASTSCSLCGKQLTERQVIPLIDHDFISNHDGVQATCTEVGHTDSYECSVCGTKKESETIPCIPHSAVSDHNGQAPTCSEVGYTDSTHCEYCGLVLSNREVLEKVAHNPIVWQNEVPATCLASGYTSSSSCATCGAILTERKEIPAKGHSFIDIEALEPTCTEVGHTAWSKCERCGFIQKEAVEIPALGHDVVYDEALEPTCLTEGHEEGSHCSRCGEILSGHKVKPALGHSVVSGDSEPDCVNLGYTGRTYCERCNVILTAGKELSPLGHDFTDDSIYCHHGCGTADPAFTEILTAEDFISALSSTESVKIRLGADIELGGKEWNPVDEWNGYLYGDGHRIYNFILSSVAPGENYGLIKVNNGIIDNVVITDFIFTYNGNTNGSAGILCGKNAGTLRNVTISDARLNYTVRDVSINLGGLTGLNDGTIEKSKVLESIVITGDNYANYGRASNLNIGMIAGANNGLLTECHTAGSISTTSHHVAARYYDSSGGSVSTIVGGIVGCVNNNANVISCLSLVEISAYGVQDNGEDMNWSNNLYVGGLVGMNYGTLMFSYVADTLIQSSPFGLAYTGGLIGYNRTDAVIEACYTHAKVKCVRASTYGGGFVGENDGKIRYSYSTGNITNTASNSNIGGFAGYNNNTGTLFKNYTTGNINTVNGSAGFFIAKIEGTLHKCFYIDSATLLKNNQYISESESSNVTAISYQKLYSEDFLVNELSWDKNGWIILTDENPMIESEFQNGHHFNSEVHAPTCENYGFTVYQCMDCNLIAIRDFVSALGHSFAEEGEEQAATCTEPGKIIYHCTNLTASGEPCSEVKEEIISDPLGHDINQDYYLKDGYSRPTCEESGRGYCNRCHDVILPPVGHNYEEAYDETHQKVLATCKDDGVEWNKCTNCDSWEKVIIHHEDVPHNYEKVDAVAPIHNITKTEDGYEVYFEDGYTSGYRCTVCHDVLSGCTVVPAHQYEEEITEQATCSSLGKKTLTCKTCLELGYEESTKEEDIPMLSHTDTDHNYICDVCNKNFISDDIDSFIPISTADDLLKIADRPAFSYILTADIDLSNVEWQPIKSFSGILFGNGYAIKGLHCNLTAADDEQLFGLFAVNTGSIIDVRLISPTFNIANTTATVGGIAAINKGTIYDCSIENGIKVIVKTYLTLDDALFKTTQSLYKQLQVTVGGIAGSNKKDGQNVGKITNCKVTGSQIVEAVVFANLTANLTIGNIGAYKKASVSMNLTLHYGGIAGLNDEGLIADSSATDENSGIGVAAISRLSTFMGKAYAHLNLYANALCGFNNKGTLSNNNAANFTRYDNCQTASELTDSLVGRFFTYAKEKASFLNGKLYTIESSIDEH